MKKLLSLVVVMFFVTTIYAQEVTLTVIGTGVDEEQATLQALRSALEQTFGAFVSSNTTILNDELIKDDIVSVTNGNIKDYQKISVVSMPNGQVSVSLIATVSVDKLLSYTKSTGSIAEFSGNAFAMNLKLLHLKIQSIQKAYDLMVQQLENIASEMFNFKLTIEDNPVSSGSFYEFNCKIEVVHDEASLNFAKLYHSTIDKLKLTNDEILLCYNEKVEMVYLQGFGTPWSTSFDIEKEWKEIDFYFKLKGRGTLTSDKLNRYPYIQKDGVLPISVEKYVSYIRRLNDAIIKAYFRCMIINISNPSDFFVYCTITNFDSALVGSIEDKLKRAKKNIALWRVTGSDFSLNQLLFDQYEELSSKYIPNNPLAYFYGNIPKDKVVKTHEEKLLLSKEDMPKFKGYYIYPVNTSILPVACEIGKKSDQYDFFSNILMDVFPK